MKSRTNDDLFSIQPKEIWQKIGENPSSIINVSNLSKAPYTLFSNSMERQLALNCLRQLLSYSALGKWDDAKGIWKLFSDLLTCPGTIYHPNPPEITPEMNPGRYIYIGLTAWQIALRNEEWEIAAEMGEQMAQAEKEAQFAKIFPDGEITCHLDLKKATLLLNAVFEAIMKDKAINEKPDVMNSGTRDALKNLYEYVKPNSKQQTGLVFNSEIYLKALKLYDENYHQFQRWQQEQFWCNRIEEHLAYLLGTGYLRQHIHGIEKKSKAIGYKLAKDGSSYFAFHRSLDSIPGFHFRINMFGLIPNSPVRRPLWKVSNETSSNNASSLYSKLMLEKKRARINFMQQYLRAIIN